MTDNAVVPRKRPQLLGLVLLSILIAYLAVPFLLLPPLTNCYPSRHAQSVIRMGYPFLRMASDNAYKDYWLEKLNEHIRQTDKTCPDRNTRID